MSLLAGGHAVARTLRGYGIKHMFGVPALPPLVDASARVSNVLRTSEVLWKPHATRASQWWLRC